MQAFTSFANIILHCRGRKLSLLTDAPPKLFVMMASTLHGADEGILLLNTDDDNAVQWRNTHAALEQIGVLVSDISQQDLTNRDVSAYLALFWRIFVHFASETADIALYRRGLYQWITKTTAPFAKELNFENIANSLADPNLYLALLLASDAYLFNPSIFSQVSFSFLFSFSSFFYQCYFFYL